MPDYGSIQRDTADEAKPDTRAIGNARHGCVLLLMFAMGVVIAALSVIVPNTCTTQLQTVFITLGSLYMAISLLWYTFLFCCGTALIESLWIPQAGQDTDALDSLMRTFFVCLFGFGFLLLFIFCLPSIALLIIWIWGAIVAATDSHDTCGSGPTVFWILMVINFVLVLVAIVYAGPLVKPEAKAVVDEWQTVSGYMTGRNIKTEVTTIKDAKIKSMRLAGCAGFYFQGPSTIPEDTPIEIHYCESRGSKEGFRVFTSFLRNEAPKQAKMEAGCLQS